MPNQGELLTEQKEMVEIYDGFPILGEYIIGFLHQARKVA